jgi:hypothetical protein
VQIRLRCRKRGRNGAENEVGSGKKIDFAGCFQAIKFYYNFEFWIMSTPVAVIRETSRQIRPGCIGRGHLQSPATDIRRNAYLSDATPPSILAKMPPIRTPLGSISGNHLKASEISPYMRGQIKGQVYRGTNQVDIAKDLKLTSSTMQNRIERHRLQESQLALFCQTGTSALPYSRMSKLSSRAHSDTAAIG